jgi:hypothetical protein
MTGFEQSTAREWLTGTAAPPGGIDLLLTMRTRSQPCGRSKSTGSRSPTRRLRTGGRVVAPAYRLDGALPGMVANGVSEVVGVRREHKTAA